MFSVMHINDNFYPIQIFYVADRTAESYSLVSTTKPGRIVSSIRFWPERCNYTRRPSSETFTANYPLQSFTAKQLRFIAYGNENMVIRQLQISGASK